MNREDLLSQIPELENRPNLLDECLFNKKVRGKLCHMSNELENIALIPDPIVAKKVIFLWWRDTRRILHQDGKFRDRISRQVYLEFYGTIHNIVYNMVLKCGAATIQFSKEANLQFHKFDVIRNNKSGWLLFF